LSPPWPGASHPTHATPTAQPVCPQGLAIDGITGFSIIPLRIASYFGVITGLIGIFMLLYSIGGKLFFEAPVGWASQTTIILVLGSGQLIVLGIIGEYLGRLYLESKRRPIYLVEHQTEGGRRRDWGPKHCALFCHRKVPEPIFTRHHQNRVRSVVRSRARRAWRSCAGAPSAGMGDAPPGVAGA